MKHVSPFLAVVLTGQFLDANAKRLCAEIILAVLAAGGAMLMKKLTEYLMKPKDNGATEEGKDK